MAHVLNWMWAFFVILELEQGGVISSLGQLPRSVGLSPILAYICDEGYELSPSLS